MKTLFNFRLYLEGLKKIKLIGIAATIVTVGLCALIPIVYMVETPSREYVYNVEIGEFAIPLLLLMGFVPFFVKSMFSYLDHRRESDFYHAIPYKRHTVYASFMLAVLTWTLAIIVAAVLVCALLWNIAPGVSFAFSTVPLLIASVFTACLMLCAFMAVAMALTGTTTSNIFIFGLITFFFRAVCLMISYALSNVVYILDVSGTILRFTDIRFFFPVALLGGAVGGIKASEVYANIPMYIYTLAVSVLLILLAGWLYVRRKSEMAGRSAPSGRLQHVYRIAFTTPFVLLAFTFVASDIFGRGGTDIAFYIVMMFVVLVVYFLYELITTKSTKSMLKSAPYLVVLLIIGVLFASGIGIAKKVVLSKTPDADEIESVIISDTGFSPYDENTLYYETLQTRNVEIKDKAVLEYISDALEFSVESVKDGTFNTHRYYESADNVVISKDDYYQYGEVSKRYTFMTVRIKLENGQTICRKIKLSEKNKTGMLSAARSTDEYANAYLKIPEPDQIYNISWNRLGSEMETVYETFYEEYTNELTREEQIEYKGRTNTAFGYHIECQGREGVTSYTFSFRIDTSMPKTLNAFAAALEDDDDSTVYKNGAETKLTNKQAIKTILAAVIDVDGDLDKLNSTQKASYVNLTFGASLYTDCDSYKGMLNIYSGQKIGRDDPDPSEAASYLLEAIESGKLRTRYEDGDCIITVDSRYYIEQANRVSLYAHMVFFCDSETAAELENYLNEKPTNDSDVVIGEKYN